MPPVTPSQNANVSGEWRDISQAVATVENSPRPSRAAKHKTKSRRRPRTAYSRPESPPQPRGVATETRWGAFRPVHTSPLRSLAQVRLFPVSGRSRSIPSASTITTRCLSESGDAGVVGDTPSPRAPNSNTCEDLVCGHVSPRHVYTPTSAWETTNRSSAWSAVQNTQKTFCVAL